MPRPFVLASLIITLFSGGAAHGQFAPLPALPCSEEAKAPPALTGPNVDVDLENGTNQVLQFFQLDANGKRDLTWRLKSQYAVRHHTHPGELWVVTDDKEQCLAVFRAGDKAGRIRLGRLPIVASRAIPPYTMRATLVEGRSLRSDGKGPYVHGQASVSIPLCEALNLWLDVVDDPKQWSRPCGTPERRNPAGQGRTLRFDLSQPVAESGAKNRGVVEDSAGNVHVFWQRDQQAHLVDSVQAIRPGMTVESDRVQFSFRSEGERYTLHMGPWVPGEFVPTPGLISGTGTSKAKLTRVSQSVWQVDAPDGTLARLWSLRDPKHPHDLGLYRFSFGLRFELLPEPAN